MLGARPRTLPAAVVPVLVGTAAAHPLNGFSGWSGIAPLETAPPVGVWWRALAALVVALAIQVGTNYANDYSDGIRGTDDDRVGPVRLVASGLASPGAVKRAALACFGVAGVVGLGLAWATSWWILVVGAACLAAGWFYTGGPRPYGYAGLGELFVFVFFGLVATVGTYYVQSLKVDEPVVWFAAVLVGLLATALLLANNLRDIQTDARTGKRTLAVRMGRRDAGWFYVACVVLPFAAVLVWSLSSVSTVLSSPQTVVALLPLVALPLVVTPVKIVASDASGRALLPVLAATGRLQMVFGALLSVVAVALDPMTVERGSAPTAPTLVGPHQSRHLVGSLQVRGVPGPGNHSPAGVGSDGLGHPQPERGELLVELTGDDQHRHGQPADRVPQRSLGAGSGQAQARRQSGAGVAQPLVQSVGGLADACEHRVLEPAPDEASRRPRAGPEPESGRAPRPVRRPKPAAGDVRPRPRSPRCRI